jgi:hypothetical protein
MAEIHFEEELDLFYSKIFGDERPVIWLDIETRKVAAPEYWQYKTRWQPFMIAVAGACDPGILFITVVSGTEKELMEFMEQFEDYEIRYSATREFDEMVLRGRFTNARRAHNKVAGKWANMDNAKVTWHNMRKEIGKSRLPRSHWDVESKNVPANWAKGNTEEVALHCERDVIELVLQDPDIHLSEELRADLIKILGG